ncbi:hypothetical protein IPM19_00715 [bacterium]|nr:MAG: hypothetical protein IPM19_00715 [bacterium]
MLIVLLGEDVYAKQEYLQNIIEKSELEIARYDATMPLPKLGSLAGQSLFGAGQIHIFSHCLGQYDLPELESAAKGTSQIVFIEDTLDKRLTKTKQLMKIAEVKEFLAPAPEVAAKWIVSHAESIGITIQPAAAAEMSLRLIGETKKNLSTTAAHNELLKLWAFAGEKTITKQMVEELTPKDLAIDLFALLDSIGQKNKPAVVRLLQQYYDSSSEDDKTLTIRLSALLADQLRSIMIVKQASEQRLSDNDLLTATGWKSGRLFIMKKLANNFSAQQLSGALNKFYNLDKELKNSNLPPRIVIDMIVAVI